MKTVVQRVHPSPYVHRTLPIEQTMAIQIAPPAGYADPCPHTIEGLAAVRDKAVELAGSEGEWVSRTIDHIPYDRITDRDLVLLAIGELWLEVVIAGVKAFPCIDVRQQVAAYSAKHPAKARLMDYHGKPFSASRSFPNFSGHKILLDRTRKMASAGLVVLNKEYTGDSGKMIYLAGIGKLGLVRLIHLSGRLRGLEDMRLQPLLGAAGITVM